MVNGSMDEGLNQQRVVPRKEQREEMVQARDKKIKRPKMFP